MRDAMLCEPIMRVAVMVKVEDALPTRLLVVEVDQHVAIIADRLANRLPWRGSAVPSRNSFFGGGVKGS